MTPRSFFLTLSTAVFGALALAVASFFWILSQSPLQLSDGGRLATPTAAMFVPRQAPLVASLLVNPSQLEALLQLQRPLGARARVQRELNEIETGLLGRARLNYRRDIRRWLGDEVTIAVTALDFDREPENGQQPGYLLVAQAKNGKLAREFLQVFFARSALAGEADLEFEPYKGTNLIYPRQRETGATPLASAVVGDRYVLFANHPKVLRDAINNVQAARLNLANAPAYQQAIDTLTAPRIATIFANLPALAAVPPGALPPEPPTLMLALQASDRGLVAQAALAGLDNANLPPAQTAAPIAALDYLPATSSLALAGRDLHALWTRLHDSAAADSPVAQLLARALTRIEKPLGLDLTEDIFNWARGEYALALLPSADGQSLDWLFAAERSADTAAAIERLDGLARARDLSVGTLPIGAVKVTAWTRLLAANRQINADVRGVRAVANNYQLLASSLSAIEQVIDPPATESRFRQALAALPDASNGYLYVDWARSQPLLERRFPGARLLTATARPLLNRLRSFSLANTGSQDGVAQAAVAFELTLEN